MQRFYTWIVHHPKTIIGAFAVAFIISVLLEPSVSVNYDINSYLPKDSPSTVSLRMMEREFDGGIPNARVMIKDVSIPEALEYKDKLLAIEGVTAVVWLDDAADIYEPFAALDGNVADDYYRNNTALYSVTIANEGKIEAVAAIRDLIGDENAMTGSAVAAATATTETVKEIGKIAIIGVAFVLFILIITTKSWFEPFVVLCGLGVAITINSGSNLIFGEISFVSNAAGNILQLAVSLDYSVFLLHRFVECREENPNVKEAMADALVKSTSSILSSGLTTVIGFAALCLMRFGIGPDLGLVLAKGIAISLITVFMFSPALILYTYKLIDKTRHRSFMPSFEGFGRFVRKLMLPMALVFALLIIPSYLASLRNDFYYGAAHIFGAETPLGADTAAIEDVFGKSDTYVLMVPAGAVSVEQELSQRLQALPRVSGVISYADKVGAEIPPEYLDDNLLSMLVSDRFSRMVVTADVDLEGKETFELVKTVRGIADEYYKDAYYLAGEGVSTYDLMDTVISDTDKVNMIAIGAVFLVLLLAMKSVSLPIILVLSIETAVLINMAAPYFADTPIFYIAYLIISSVQLGATVDYAILFTDRYNEYRAGSDKKKAVVETVSSVTLSVLTSGITLTAVGFLLGIFSTHGLLSQLGYFLGKGTLCSLTVVLFVLPGLLYVFDGVIRHSAINFSRFKKPRKTARITQKM